MRRMEVARSRRPTALTRIAIASWLLWAAPAAADDAAPLRSLADAARATLAQRIEPPASRVPFLCTLRRTEAAPLREYILQQQAEAIEVLLASANSSPADADRVRRLLAKLERDGYAREADARLAETVPGGATGLRLAASLGELPAALHDRLLPGGRCGSTYVGLVGRTLQPLGALARGDYQRLVALEPSDPWHSLVLAWIEGADGEAALQLALSQPSAGPGSDAARVRILALQQLAWLRRDQSRFGESEQAARAALDLSVPRLQAAGDDRAQPAAEQALRDAALVGGSLALALEDAGRKAAAFEVLLGVASQQRRLVELRPDSIATQLALVDTLSRLALLRDAAGPGAAYAEPAKAYLDAATSLYRRLEQRTPYTPMIEASQWPGMLVAAAALAGALTLVGGWVALHLYRRRVAQLMMASSRARAAPTPAADEVPLATADAAVLFPGSAAVSLAQAGRAQRRAVLVQIAAGLAFGALAAGLQLLADDTAPDWLRTALMTWTWAWPTVLAVGFVRDGDRRARRVAWAVYFAGLLAICGAVALSDTPAKSILGVTVPPIALGLLFWALSLSYSPFLLLFLNRAVRSIGPALLAMMLVTMAGAIFALVASSTPVGMAAVASMFARVGLPAEAFGLATMLAGALAAAPLAWWIGRRLRAAYAAKWLTDQSLMIDTLWGFQAMVLAFDLNFSIGPWGWFGLGAFALHKAITWAGMAQTARAARQRKPLRLLLLRVFSRRDRSGRVTSRRGDAERLFDLLGSRWRYAGPIAMIGAPDLASSTIDPDEFLDFLAGRLRERFILEPADVRARIAAVDDRCDFDGRWRVTEFFCGNDTWRATVLGLMSRSDLVAMDLRDFGLDNQGCLFELQALIDLVPAHHVALLVDASTRRDFLDATLDGCFGRVPATSPNARGGAHLATIDITSSETAAIDELLHRAAAAARPPG